MARRTRPQDQPLQVKVERGRLVISIGIDTLAWAFEHSELAQPYDEEASRYRQAYVVTDKVEFAKDVLRALDKEEEDGTTPVHLLLDKAMKDALDDGSIAVEESSGPAKDQ